MTEVIVVIGHEVGVDVGLSVLETEMFGHRPSKPDVGKKRFVCVTSTSILISIVSLLGNHGEGESAQLGPPGLRRGSRPRERRRSEEEPLLQHVEEIPGHQTGKTAGM